MIQITIKAKLRFAPWLEHFMDLYRNEQVFFIFTSQKSPPPKGDGL